MGQILHKCARTTHSIRKEIQNSKENVYFLARKFNVSRPTIYRWKNDSSTEDKRSGATKLRSILSPVEEKIICAFRQKTLFSLDDCYISLKDEIPNLSRSNLHRCLQRNKLSRLKDLIPQEEQNKKSQFKTYPIGYVHIDTTNILLGKDMKYSLFVAIERNTKFVHIKLTKKKTMMDSGSFLEEVIDKFPFKIHTILTDNGIEYTFNLFKKPVNKVHKIDMICNDNNIEHRLTKFKSPWTNGQVEIMNKQIKENTTRKYQYSSFEQLEKHLKQYLFCYNFAKRLKSLRFLTPYQKMIEYYEKDKKNNIRIFRDNTVKKLMGLYN